MRRLAVFHYLSCRVPHPLLLLLLDSFHPVLFHQSFVGIACFASVARVAFAASSVVVVVVVVVACVASAAFVEVAVGFASVAFAEGTMVACCRVEAHYVRRLLVLSSRSAVPCVVERWDRLPA